MNHASPRFEAIVLPHLDAAYNLARWLVRDEHAAEDVVQEAYLRAFRYFAGFHGDDARAWLLGIVRNTSYSWLQINKRASEQVAFDDEIEMELSAEKTSGMGTPDDPETILLRKAERTEVNAAIRSLPAAFREVLILREIEELPYDSIATAMRIPVGTVMSRLSRARAMLRIALEATLGARTSGV